MFNSNTTTGVGVTNQRETIIVWDKKTGKPLYNAIVWMDCRSKAQCAELIEKHSKEYFVVSKWIVLYVLEKMWNLSHDVLLCDKTLLADARQ